MKPSPLLLLAACALPLAAPAADSESRQTHTFSAGVPAGGMHEECVRLAKDETRRFEWKSDAPVDFNIHYHEGPEVFYPMKKEGATGDKGTFRAKVAQDYCWMWTAKGAAKIEGRVEK